MRKALLLTLFGALAFSSLACATTSKDKKDLTAEEIARYQEAIDRDPSTIPEGTEFVVSVSGEAPVVVAPVEETPVVSRNFEIPASDYDAFFAQSPAVVLARVQLEPVRDGSSLLGYKIVKFTKGPFSGVDVQENDIIVGVNGKMPNNPDDYFNAWEAMKASGKATVDIQRSVDRFTITWNKN